MPGIIPDQAPKSAAVASCYCAKPPQTGCGGSSGTPKEKTTTAAVAAVATATAAAVQQFSLQGVPHRGAAKLSATLSARSIFLIPHQRKGPPRKGALGCASAGYPLRLNTACKSWADANGELPGSNKRFSETLANRGFAHANISKARGFRGLALRQAQPQTSPIEF